MFLGGVRGRVCTLCLFVLVRNGSLCCVCFGEREAVNIMSKTFEYLEISLLKYLEMYLMCSGLGGEEFLRGVCLGRGAVGAVNIMNKGSIPPPAGTTTTMYQS